MVNPRNKKIEKFDNIRKPARITSGKNNVKNRLLGHNELQIKIAKHIAMNGEKSPFDLENELRISKTLSNKTIGKMLDHKYIHQVKSKKVSGGDRLFYKLTETGIKWIFDKGDLSHEEFWNLLFLIHSKDYDTKNFKSIENMIKEFEISNQINREHFFLYHHFGEFAKIGNLVTKDKMMTQKEKNEENFYETIKPIFINIILNKKQKIDKNILFELDVRRLINITHNDERKIDTYYLTPFGDMLLLYCFYDSAVNMEKIKISHIKRKLEKKYPMVFSNWDLIKEVTNWGDTSLVNCFLNLHVRDPNKIFEQHKHYTEFYAKIGFDDDVELLKMFFFMQKRMKFQLKNEFDSATKIIEKWAQKEQVLGMLFNFHKMPSKHIKILAIKGVKKYSNKKLKSVLLESSKYNRNRLEYDDNLHKDFDEKWKTSYLSRSEEEEIFLKIYRNEQETNTDAIKKVVNAIKPIIQYAELYNYMVPRDPELYLSRATSKLFSNKIFSSLYNIISFQFFLILKLGTSPKKWDQLMNHQEMKKMKSWFEEWIKVITEYYLEIIHKVRENKSEYSEYSNLSNPVLLEEVLVSKHNWFDISHKIQNAS